jgi:SAM-dependent methyltransferase
MDCRSCRTALPAPFLDLGPQPSGPELVDPSAEASEDRMVPLRVSACSACGLVQLSDRMSLHAGVGHGHAAAVSATLADHERRWATELVAPFEEHSGRIRVLDISSGDGTLLRAIQAASQGRTDPLGFEPGESQPAAPGTDVPIRHRSFDLGAAGDLRSAGWLADLVIASHALAHVDEPADLLDAIARVLAPGGRLAIETHHLIGIVRDGQFDAISHAHAIYPSLGSLIPLLTTRGFALTRAKSVDAYGGSIRLEATWSNNTGATVRDAAAPNVRAIVAAEAAAHLTDPATMSEIGQRAARVAADLHGFLTARRDEGARVAGYGAPARGGILLNLAGVDDSLLPFTVDLNPAKQGRARAGCRIPVFPPRVLSASPPDYLLILPWTLLPEIEAQVADLTQRGTILVVAMPELRVLNE